MSSSDAKFRFDGRSFPNKQALYSYIDSSRGDELERLGWEPSRYWFFVRYGKKEGRSVISGKPTAWNPVTERYERFADEEEKKEYVKQFQERMKRKYGKTHLTDDPEHQKRMLGGRSIAKVYRWANGKETEVTGTYEQHFLHFLESVYGFEAEHLGEPPTIYYKLDGVTKFYLPDFFIPSLNLIVEVKGGNEHYQARDAHKEGLKEAAAREEGFDFVQVNDKHYSEFHSYFRNKVLTH